MNRVRLFLENRTASGPDADSRDVGRATKRVGLFLATMFCLVMFSGTGIAANKDWTGAVSTDWNTAGNWTGGIPGSGDVARIGFNAITNQPTISSANTISGLTYGNVASSTLTINANLTINGAITNNIATTAQVHDINLSSGVTLSCTSVSLTPAPAAANMTITFNGGILTCTGNFSAQPGAATTNITLIVGTGNLSIGGTTTQGPNSTVERNCSITVSTGSLTFTGPYTKNGNSSVLTSSGAATVTFSDNVTNTRGTFDLTGSTTTLNKSGAADQQLQPTVAMTFGSVIVNRATTTAVVTTTGNLSMAGNLTVTSGVFDHAATGRTVTGVGASNTLQVQASGTLKIRTTGTTPYASSYPGWETRTLDSGCTIEWDSNTAKTWDITSFPGNVIISNGTGASINNLGGDTVISGSLTHSGGDLSTTASNFSLTVTGDYALATDTLTANGSTVTITGNFTGTGILNAGTSTFIFNGGGAQTVAGSSVLGNYNNIEINKSGGAATINNDTTIGGTVIVTSGTFNTGGFDLTVTGTTSISGTLGITVGTGGAITFGNLVVNSGGTFNNNTVAEDVTINGNLQNDGTFNAGTGAQTYTFAGASKTISGTTSIAFPGMSIATGASYAMSNDNSCTSLTFVAAATASSLTHGSASALTVNGAVTLNQPGNNSVTTAWNINGGSATVSGLITFAGTNTTASRVAKIVTTTGTLNANGGITFVGSVAAGKVIDMSGGAGTLNFKGALTVPALSSTLTAGTAGSTFNYADSAAQTVNYFTAGAYHNLNVNNTNASGATLSAAVTTGNVTGDISVGNVNSGSLFSTNNLAIGINNSKGITVASGSTMNASISVITYGTSGTATINGTFKTANTVGFSGSATAAINSTNTPTISLGASSTIEFTAAGTQTVTQRTDYANVTLTGGSKTIGTAAAQTVTLSKALTIGSGATYNGATNNPVLNVGGDFSNSGTFTQGTGLVTFTGTSILGGSGTIDFNNMTISGILTNNTNNKDFGMLGNWTNNGTYTTGTETITFKGSAAQTIGGSASTAFSGLTIANTGAGTTTMNTSGSVSGALTLTTDLTVTGPAVLTQSGTSAGNGDVVGNVKRNLSAGVTGAFGNPNVQLQNANAITVTVNLVKGLQPLHLASGVKRQYVLTETGNTVSNATVRLHYLGSELNGNSDSNVELYRSANGGTSYVSVGANSRGTAVDTDRWVEVTGQGAFSPWGIAGPNAPTDIAMVGYGASHSREGKVLLQWETGREVNNLGFNVYREDSGQRVRLNKSLIVGSGLTARPGTVMSAGRSYAWMTSSAQAKESVFWIEEIDFSGRTVWHGPIHSQEAAGGALTLSTKQQAIIEQTSTVSDLAQESTFNGVTRPVQTLANMAKPGAAKTTPSGITPQPPITLFNPSVKLTLKQEGWYRIGQPQLVAAGLDASVNPALLQLFADGNEVPMSVTNNNGVFDSTSVIEFYGLPIDTPSTDTHVYTLTAGSSGKRIQSETGQGGLPPANSFLYTVERKDRSIYVSGIHNGDAENFFGSVVSSSPVDQALTITNVDATAAGQATIEVGMQGLSLTPHIVTVNLNGNPIGTISYDSQAQGVAQFTVANSSLLEGQNLVTLSGQPSVFDLSLVDHIRVSYWHSYAADGNALKFTATANQQVTLSGFTSADVRVFDVTDPNAPQKVEASVTSQKTNSAIVVTVAVPGTGARTLLAIGDDQTRSPLAVLTNKPSTWKSKSNAADLVIITHDSLTDSFKQLQTLRQSQGLKVALVDVDDIYDEFNSGNKSPQAIKDFLAYAKANWKTAPKYVLLAGSASYDPKNYNGLGGFDLVPTKLIDTSFSETASDDWVADFNMDGIAEMAVGRLPTPTSEEAQTTVTKLAAYEGGNAFTSSLLVADQNLDFDFEAANAALAALFPGSITVQQINRGQIGTAAARQQLLDGIASGQKIVNYVGHGSPSVWRDNLLTSADALGMTNIGRYPLFIAMTCLNGEFQHPELNTLAAALMNSREGGAIAVWASSGFTIPAEQAVMNQQFYTLLFPSNKPTKGKAAQASLTLGEITNSAKSSVSDPDVRRTWILFGDPSMRVK